MASGTEVHIDRNIHYLVDLVYRKTYRFTGPQLQSLLKTARITVDVSKLDGAAYLPPYECLYYPTVSKEKCVDDYDESDWQGFEGQLQLLNGKTLPTFHLYRLHNLNNELQYFLKLILHTTLNPQEGLGNWSFEYFLRHYYFIKAYFPDQNLLQHYEKLWCDVLESLKTDSAVTRMGRDGNLYPLGFFAFDQIEWLKAKIGC